MLHQLLLSFITLFPPVSFSANPEHLTSAPEIVPITVTTAGNALIGNKIYLPDRLYTAIEKKLWNKYPGAVKMQDLLTTVQPSYLKRKFSFLSQTDYL